MPGEDRFLEHTFGGGLATDLGPFAPNRPQGDQVVVPWLTAAENVEFEQNGGIRKVGGTVKLFSSALEGGAEVLGVFDYWQIGTSGSPSQHRLLSVGTTVKKDDADETFTNLFTGLQSGAVPHFFQFDDIVIFANDSSSDVPRSWDGTTAQNLAGTPPNFAFGEVHKGRAWAAGVDANPSRLYYSTAFDPEDWVGVGSGSIDIDPNDGDRLTAIASYKDELIAFKGPYKGSVHRVTGSAPSDFALRPAVRGIGAVWQNAVFRFANDLGFIWTDGSVYSLETTDEFGDIKRAALSRDIASLLDQNVNRSQGRLIQAVDWPTKGQVYIGFPTGASMSNDLLAIMDYRFRATDRVRWTTLPAFSGTCSSLALVVDNDQLNRPVVMAGGTDGFVRKLGQNNRSLDSGTSAYKALVTTPSFSYVGSRNLKTISGGSVGFVSRGNGTINFRLQRDAETEQSFVVSQSGGSDVLGPASSGAFTLGTSTLGGSQFIEQFKDFEGAGEFRVIRYTLDNDELDVDMEVHAFGANLESGPASWE